MRSHCRVGTGPGLIRRPGAAAEGGPGSQERTESVEPAAKWPEEGADLLGQELRLLERVEVASRWYFPPALHVEEPRRPLAWRARDVLREERESGGRGLATEHLLHALGHPRDGPRGDDVPW